MMGSTVTLLGSIFLGFVLFIVVMRTVRRRRYEPPNVNYDFSLDELYRLHASGKLTAEEFERARAVVLARQAGAPGATAPPSTVGRGFEVVRPTPAPPPVSPKDVGQEP